MRISLVIPVKDEERSLPALIESIRGQSLAPAEVIFVDGGSSDGTVATLKSYAGSDESWRVIEVSDATPGKGRNIGSDAAASEWIAYTDAGIVLDRDWLEQLSRAAESNPETAVVYGNYTPVTERWFETIACVSYCAAQGASGIRGKSIASSLVKKSAWQKVGGFPDLRAGEDLIFMEKLSAAGFPESQAPEANINWSLRPGILATFKKFDLYAKKSSMFYRTHDWHHGILRQYILILPFLVLGVLSSRVWFFAVPIWMLARAVKRAFAHRYEFGVAFLLNPLNLVGVVSLILVIDLATFSGWIRGVASRGERPI